MHLLSTACTAESRVTEMMHVVDKKRLCVSKGGCEQPCVFTLTAKHGLLKNRSEPARKPLSSEFQTCCPEHTQQCPPPPPPVSCFCCWAFNREIRRILIGYKNHLWGATGRCSLWLEVSHVCWVPALQSGPPAPRFALPHRCLDWTEAQLLPFIFSSNSWTRQPRRRQKSRQNRNGNVLSSGWMWVEIPQRSANFPGMDKSFWRIWESARWNVWLTAELLFPPIHSFNIWAAQINPPTGVSHTHTHSYNLGIFFSTLRSQKLRQVCPWPLTSKT